MIIPAKSQFNWLSGFWQEDFENFSQWEGISHLSLFFWNHKTDLNQTWQKCSLDGHIQDLCFWCWSEIQHGCLWPSNEHFCQDWFKSVLLFQKKRWKCEIPIGSNVKLSRVMAAILNFRSANDTFKSSPLKTLCQMNWKLVGSIYGRSSLKGAHFVLIHYQTWPPQAILVSEWPIFSSPGHRPCELLSWVSGPSWISDRQTIHSFSTGPPNDHSCKVTIQLT
jgi:hypothetical protein